MIIGTQQKKTKRPPHDRGQTLHFRRGPDDRGNGQGIENVEEELVKLRLGARQREISFEVFFFFFVFCKFFVVLNGFYCFNVCFKHFLRFEVFFAGLAFLVV